MGKIYILDKSRKQKETEKGKELVPLWGIFLEEMKWFRPVFVYLFWALLLYYSLRIYGGVNRSFIEKIDDIGLIAGTAAFAGLLTWNVLVKPLYQNLLKVAEKITVKEPFEKIRMKIYEDGYGDGYKTGQEHGQMAGYDEGHNVGYGRGHEEGYTVGHEEGHEKGIAIGIKRGRMLEKATRIKEDLPF